MNISDGIADETLTLSIYNGFSCQIFYWQQVMLLC